MRILIATPLYPPDIAPSACYVKELATRLSHNHHVTVLAYGHIPEHIPHVTFITIEKSSHLIRRMARFSLALLKEGVRTDALIVENGPSVEVPFVLVLPFLFLKKRIVEKSDAVAVAHAQGSRLYRILDKVTCRSARHVHTSLPRLRPEILPFVPYPREAERAYEESWNVHMKHLETHLI